MSKQLHWVYAGREMNGMHAHGCAWGYMCMADDGNAWGLRVLSSPPPSPLRRLPRHPFPALSLQIASPHVTRHLALALPAGREFAQLPPGNAPLQRAAPHVRVLGDGERSVFALSAEGGAQAHGLQLEAEAPPLDQLHTEEEGVFWR